MGWKQDDLAKAAKIGIATIRRIEGEEGPVMGYISTLMRIQSAFEQTVIRFLDNDIGRDRSSACDAEGMIGSSSFAQHGSLG